MIRLERVFLGGGGGRPVCLSLCVMKKKGLCRDIWTVWLRVLERVWCIVQAEGWRSEVRIKWDGVRRLNDFGAGGLEVLRIIYFWGVGLRWMWYGSFWLRLLSLAVIGIDVLAVHADGMGVLGRQARLYAGYEIGTSSTVCLGWY